jgi:hypothetical protein
MISATTSMMTKVITYWASSTAKVIYGGTKKKSNANTPSTVANAPGPRPKRAATSTMASRKTIALLASARPISWKAQATSEATTIAASDHA